MSKGNYKELPYLVTKKETIYTGNHGRQTNGMAIFILDNVNSLALELLVINLQEHIEVKKRARVFKISQDTLNMCYGPVPEKSRVKFLAPYLEAGYVVTNKRDISQSQERRKIMAKNTESKAKSDAKAPATKGKGKDKAPVTKGKGKAPATKGKATTKAPGSKGRKPQNMDAKIKVLNTEPKFNEGSKRAKAFKQIKDGMTMKTYLARGSKMDQTDAQMKGHLSKLLILKVVELK